MHRDVRTERMRSTTREGGGTMEDEGFRPMAGKTVLITGSTGGIGRATALGLAAIGARVAVTGRDPSRTEDAAQEIRAVTGAPVEAFVADVSSQREVRRLASEVLGRLPRLDVL